MDEDRAGTVREWNSRSVEGHAGLRQLAGEEFSGVIETDRGSIRAFMTNGRVVGVDGADIDDLDGMAMTAYAAPDDAIPLLFAMQARGSEPRAQYYTEETSLTEVNQTLEEGGFTGYVELSENVLSGDYYVVYHGGRSSSVAFVGSSSRLLTGDEAFERAADEVGIFDVVDVDVSVVDVPGDTPDAAAGDGGVAAGSTAGDVNRASAAGTGDTAGAPAGESGDSPTGDETEAGATAGEGGAVDATEPDRGAGETPGDATDTPVPESADGATDAGPSSGTGGDDRAADVDGGSSDSSGPYGTGEEIRVGAGLGAGEEEDDTGAGSDADTGEATVPERSGPEATAAPSSEQPRESETGTEDAETTAEGEIDDGGTATGGDDGSTVTDDGGTAADGDDGSTATDGDDGGTATDDGGTATDDGGAAAADGTASETAADAPDRPSEPPEGDSGPPSTDAARGGAKAATDAERETATGPGEEAATDAGSETAAGGGETARAADGREAGADTGAAAGPPRERLQAELQETRETLERVRAERDDYRADAERLRERVETLESRIDALEADAEDEDADRDLDAAQSLAPSEALADTNLFVRYESKADPTLEDAHDGGADPDAVNRNLRLEHHTRFEAADVAVDGERFESFLTSSFEYRFVEWVVRKLLYELRSTGGDRGMEKLYDAIPAVDRIHFDGEVQVGGEEGEADDARQFDVIFRDRMGGPLLVANLHESRDPTEAGAVTTLIEDARTVAASAETIGAAVAVTTSYYEPQALKAASGATGGGFLSRSSKESYVKMDRKRGFHLCLIEARDGEFNLKIPDR